MDKNINSKSAPNQMRILMKRIRENKFVGESNQTPKKDLSVRDMIKITRRINEDEIKGTENTNETIYLDSKILKDELQEIFKNNDMDVVVEPLDKIELTKNYGFWGGTVSGMLQFVYKATVNENSSGVEYKYLKGFTQDNPDNDKIIKLIESFYDRFYEYWRDEISKINTN